MRRVARTLSRGLLVALSCSACGDSVAPARLQRVRAQPEWVTDAAAAALDVTTGLFRLTPVNPRYKNAASAESLTVAWLHAVNSPNFVDLGFEAAVEHDRGAPVDLPALVPCDVDPSYEYGPFGDF